MLLIVLFIYIDCLKDEHLNVLIEIFFVFLAEMIKQYCPVEYIIDFPYYK